MIIYTCVPIDLSDLVLSFDDMDFEKVTKKVPESFFSGRSYEEILESELRKDYEALA